MSLIHGERKSPRAQKHQSSVPLPTIQSATWLVRAKVREPHLNPPVRMNFLPLALVLKGESQESSYEPAGSDVVRELSREPAMFHQEEVSKYGFAYGSKR